MAAYESPTRQVVTMAANGRITLPAEVRERMGISGPTTFTLEVDDTLDAIVLRPALVMAREDAWAYTPEHQQSLQRAREDIAQGRVYKASEEELQRVLDTGVWDFLEKDPK